MKRDAGEIEDALLGIVDPLLEFFGESLIVETTELDVITSLAGALVRCQTDVAKSSTGIDDPALGMSYSARAAEDKGKGTFWVSEMEQVMIEVAQQSRPRVMTSTFRGRGMDVAGQIFRPQLDQVDFVDDKPVRYYFVFYEVLVPELVRGPDRIGDVFNLLYIVMRVRWEVLNPFLVNLSLAKAVSPAQLTQAETERHESIVASVVAYAS